MSIYVNLTKEDMIQLAKLSDQEKKKHKANKFQPSILKQTSNEQLAETFKRITKKL